MRAAAVPLFILIVLVGIFYWFFRSEPGQENSSSTAPSMPQRVELKTNDAVSIIGDYYAPAENSPRGLVLLHMMPATRQSWKAFAEKMQSASWRSGWHVLAVDLRGHGESEGGPDGYRTFSDAEHQASRADVEASVEFLKSTLRQSSGQEGVIYLGGASIGANLALQYLAEHPDTRAAFLLSPGLDYRGVTTAASVRSLKSGQAIYVVASRDDAYSADTIQQLYDAASTGVKKDIKFFETAGHGTTIFEREPQFMDELFSWLQTVASSSGN